MRFITKPLTHRGGRNQNEDFCDYYAVEDGGCWVVADGLGGHFGGKIASETAGTAFIESFAGNSWPLAQDALCRHLRAAHEAVLRRQQVDSRLAGMRTTLVALISDGSSALWAHIGDSRLYGFRGEKIVVATKDHSVPQAMVDAGEIPPEAIRHHEDRNRLLRDLGGEKGIRPAIPQAPWKLQDGDKFLLCTDGFWEYITETAMEAELAKSDAPGQWIENMERRIQKSAPDDHDNYTAIAIFVEN